MREDFLVTQSCRANPTSYGLRKAALKYKIYLYSYLAFFAIYKVMAGRTTATEPRRGAELLFGHVTARGSEVRHGPPWSQAAIVYHGTVPRALKISGGCAVRYGAASRGNVFLAV